MTGILNGKTQTWAITGVAGFIGSNLLEALLKQNQVVVGLDSFLTGKRENLEDVKTQVSLEQWKNFRFIEGDIRDLGTCKDLCRGADYLLHEAALGSVPRSIEDPILTNSCNITGYLNILVAARDAGIKRTVYAASSSTYGDHPGLPKVEDHIGRPLSPYAVTKYVNELYADVFTRAYGMQLIGLRYFNVFGRRQDPEGAYAAVIPKWIAAMLENRPVQIYGDGETSRDFCYIKNVIQANLLAATIANPDAINQVYNVAVGDRTTLNQLYRRISDLSVARYPHLKSHAPTYAAFRPGDVQHSQADIGKIKRLLNYQPTHTFGSGLEETIGWYEKNAHGKGR